MTTKHKLKVPTPRAVKSQHAVRKLQDMKNKTMDLKLRDQVAGQIVGVEFTDPEPCSVEVGMEPNGHLRVKSLKLYFGEDTDTVKLKAQAERAVLVALQVLSTGRVR